MHQKQKQRRSVATPVYYDLNGRMVDAEMGLAPGIYVKRIGMKSQKILVR